MLIDPRNGPAYDLPRDAGSRRTYVLASVPRCGSTLLARALTDAGGVGSPKEYLNPMQIRDWEVRAGSSLVSRHLHARLRGPLLPLAGRGPWTRARLAGHLERVRHRRSSGGWFGLKIHHHHFRHWFLDRGWDPASLLGELTWVRVRREDRVGQAVSWARALQTGQWASWQPAGAPPRYRRLRIQRCLDAIAEQEAGWDAWFDARGIVPLVVSYEALTKDWSGSVGGVMASLGAPRVAVPAPALERQADAISAQWRARFQAGE